MVMSVAPVMDQRNVEDCPGSMVDGSAVKLLITGAPAGGGAVAVGVGAGGGGGGGTFFLQPAANITSATNSTAPSLEAYNLELSFIGENLLFVVLSIFVALLIIVLTYSKQVFRCCLAL
jgi:hypothetical protein